MSEVELSAVVSVLDRIRGTSSKNEKVAYAAQFLSGMPSDQLADTARLMIGQVLPVEHGSLGTQYSDLSNIDSIGRQTQLFSEKLTVRKVVKAFAEISSISGSKSRQRKASVLNGLMMNASKVERDFLIDCVTGDIRSGFSEGL
ncbi:MAG: hypothetical protein OEV21_03885, partial [Thermoplasmata archaeon]|nr:hypothetical protein [Thermoplasmata archaeon]